jgi:uncharacterized protein YukE
MNPRGCAGNLAPTSEIAGEKDENRSFPEEKDGLYPCKRWNPSQIQEKEREGKRSPAMAENNEEVKAKLLEGNRRFSSAATVMGNVLNELDLIIASLDLAWLGSSYQAYTTAHAQFVKDVGTARDILQKCADALKTMHDKIVEAEEKVRKQEVADVVVNVVILGVLVFADAVAAVVTPLLVAADETLAATFNEIASETLGLPTIGEEVTEVAEITPVEVPTVPVENTPATVDYPTVHASEAPGTAPTAETANAPTPTEVPNATPPTETPDAPTTTDTPTTPEVPNTTPPTETPDTPTETANTPGDTPTNAPTPVAEKTPQAKGDPSGMSAVPTEEELPPPYDADTRPPAYHGNETYGPKPANAPAKHDSGFFDGPSEPAKPGDLPLGKSTSGKNLDDFLPPRPVEVEVNIVRTDGLGITMDHPPADATVIEGPSQETFVDSVTGNTTVVDIDAAGNQTITVTDPAGNTTITEPDPMTGNPQTTEIFTDPLTGNTTVTNTTTRINHVTRITTKTVIDHNGNETITQILSKRNPNTGQVTTTVRVFDPDETVTVTTSAPGKPTTKTVYHPNGTQTVTVTQPDGTETIIHPDGSSTKIVNNSDGSKTVSKVETVIDPETQQPTKAHTVTKTTAPDAQGNVTITEIVTDPTTGRRFVTQQTLDGNGNPVGVPTTIEIDANGYPVEPSQAGPSRPPKRPVEDDPNSPPDPSDPKGKKVKR